MTNWWLKIADKKELEGIRDKLTTFKDRNLLNKKIGKFKDVAVSLFKIVKGGQQDIVASREIINSLLKDKSLSSYPQIIKCLKDAYDVAMDSHNRFRGYCRDALKIVYAEIKEMEKKRKEFVDKELPRRLKERFDNGKR